MADVSDLEVVLESTSFEPLERLRAFPADLISGVPAQARAVGHGGSIAHHGELFQGVLETAEHGLCRCLVSLPSGLFRSRARFLPGKASGLRLTNPEKEKSKRAALLTLADLGVPDAGGILEIENNIPASWGLGSSTSDVIAAIRAVAMAFGAEYTPDAIARIAVRAETASDSTMYGHQAVLFAQRLGVPLEVYGRVLPAFEVLGFNTDCTGAGVDTLAMPPAKYDWREVESFKPLATLLRRAVLTNDAALLAMVASASARINQRHLPKPHFDRIEKIADRTGALGIQVAHSGTVMGVLFGCGDPDLDERMAAAAAELESLGFRPSWRFRSALPAPAIV